MKKNLIKHALKVLCYQK